jgi:predicted adenine nucleotide alpha hydrolase (AANH) superfamily ATPase
MRILLHTCCAPCATHPLRVLATDSHLVVAYFHNPNIHPEPEFAHRLDALVKLTDIWSVKRIVDPEYGLARFLHCVDGVASDAERCARCYALRLDAAARRAAAEGFDAFTTSLLVSPYQKHDLIIRAGEESADRNKIAFHYRDFRDGFGETRIVSRELDLYRQKYCGCLYSEQEQRRERPRRREGGAGDG